MTLFVPPSGRRTTERTSERTADRAPGTVRRDVPGPTSVADPSRRPAAVAAWLSRAAVVAVLAVQLAVPGGWGDVAWVPLVAGLLIGLPHDVTRGAHHALQAFAEELQRGAPRERGNAPGPAVEAGTWAL